MTPSNRYEFWQARKSDAEIARDVAESRLATVQNVGQMALFRPPKPDIYKERHGEVIPLPVREDLPDIAA